jgi:hypothetical protein
MRALFRKSIRAKHFILIVLAVPVALMWGEVFTRALLPQNVDSRMNIFQSDPVVGFMYKPYAKTYEKGREYNVPYRINSSGLRDHDYKKKSKGAFRILLLGDSFSVSHGLPIEDSLSRQLGEALQGRATSDEIPVAIEVVNAAVGGYSPFNYWKAYHKWASLYEPDIVVVGLSPDDYDCSNENMTYSIERGETLATRKESTEPNANSGMDLRKVRKWLSWNSELYVLLRNFYYYNDFVGMLNLWISARAHVHTGQVEPYIVPQTEGMSKAWGKTFSYLRSLRLDAAADGIMLVVIPLPLKMEIVAEEYERIVKANDINPEEIDMDQPLKGISAFCRSESIPVIDPRPAMRSRNAQVPCYFVYDGHWNAEGIHAATVYIAEQWRSLGLPPWQHAALKKQRKASPARF